MNSKQKGKRGELEWASYCRQQGYECRRTSQYCGNTGDASDVVGLPGIHQEVKRVEHLNIYEAIEQAERDKKDFEIPIVAHRKNRFPWLVTMKAEDWFKIYREFEAGRDEHKPILMAISALRQQETVTNRNGLNEPMTLDELRQMGGDPVFVVTDRLKEWCLVHSHNSDDVIGGGIIMTRRTAEKRTYQYACYGKTWLAYRQKPEEDDHE